MDVYFGYNFLIFNGFHEKIQKSKQMKKIPVCSEKLKIQL